ncbi:MAG: hypothetical protein ACFFDN_10590 [Candidatus Hodarchaeota archaeon]
MEKNEKIELIIAGSVFFGLFFGLGLLLSWLDYSLNQSIIDSTVFAKFEWWTWITYKHWWTWMFAKEFNSYLLLSAIVCVILDIFVILFYYIYRDF